MSYQTTDEHMQAVLDFLDDGTKSIDPDCDFLNFYVSQGTSSQLIRSLVYFLSAHLAGKHDIVDYLQPYLDEVRAKRI